VKRGIIGIDDEAIDGEDEPGFYQDPSMWILEFI
jgi:hypothetical protein